VPCIDKRLGALASTFVCSVALVGCGQTPPPPAPSAPAGIAAPSSPKPGPAPQAGAKPVLPPAGRARSWDDFKRQAAQRLVAANAGRTFDGPVPEPLLAIPVLEIELESDGRVSRVNVLRYPRQAKDTTQLAIDAVYRAAPFGPVGHLPRPWKFAEVFLFDDDRRFKPRTLDE
jgi:protein TonB